ncbi:hypothetical protein [Alkalibacterium sp.]|nr:MAG: hypothetical protein EA249_09150 [Alkalibacterium sp.]
MFEFWIEAERFYTFIMPVVIIAYVFLIGVIILIYTYAERIKLRRRVTVITVLTATLLASGYFLFGHFQYRQWVQQNDFIHPGIREYSYILGIRTDEDRGLVRVFRRSSNIYGQMSELDMYEARTVEEDFPYNYLGSRDSTHYFSFGEDEQFAFRIRGDVTWTEDRRELVGTEFHLTDERFETIGFVPYSAPIFETVYLPEEEQRELVNLSDYQIVSVSRLYAEWIFPNQSN